MAPKNPTGACRPGCTTCGHTSMSYSTTTTYCATWLTAASPCCHRRCANPLTAALSPSSNKQPEPSPLYQVHGAAIGRATAPNTGDISLRECRCLPGNSQECRGDDNLASPSSQRPSSRRTVGCGENRSRPRSSRADY